MATTKCFSAYGNVQASEQKTFRLVLTLQQNHVCDYCTVRAALTAGGRRAGHGGGTEHVNAAVKPRCSCAGLSFTYVATVLH